MLAITRISCWGEAALFQVKRTGRENGLAVLHN